MTPVEKFFAILALLQFCAWLIAWCVDEQLSERDDDTNERTNQWN